MFMRRLIALAAGLIAACALAGMAAVPAAATVSPAIGGQSNQLAISQCPGNEIAVGIVAGMSDHLLTIAPECADASSGPWQMSEQHAGTTLGGGTASSANYRSCFSPQALYGVQAAVQKNDGHIVGLKTICGSSPFNDDVGNLAAGSNIIKTAVVCGPGLTAVGIRAWFADAAHQTIVGFALQCLNAPASVGGVAAATSTSTSTSSASGGTSTGGATSGSSGSGSAGSSGGSSSGASASADAQAFVNVWNVKASDGTQFTMELSAKGGSKLSGTYDTGGRDGEINGTVKGKVFTYKWKLTGSTIANGSGAMTLAADGKSWNGTWIMEKPTPFLGFWSGSL